MEASTTGYYVGNYQLGWSINTILTLHLTMIVNGKTDRFEIRCESCDMINLERQSPETLFEDFRVHCPSCGGVAVVEDDAGIIKVYSLDDADIDATVL